MSRKPRQISSTNYYHIVFRGNNKQQIFETPEDYKLFLEILRKVLDVSDCCIHAYAIMGNHIHILIETPGETLTTVVERIMNRFTSHYNEKYDRVGHLMQDRFFSEPVEDERYLRTVFRYILRNPIKAGMEQRFGDYPWTSFGAYIGRSDGITTTEAMETYFPNIAELVAYIAQENEDICPDMDNISRWTTVSSEMRAHRILEDDFKMTSFANFLQLPLDTQVDCFRAFYSAGISIRCIARLTGASRYKVTKYLKVEESAAA